MFAIFLIFDSGDNIASNIEILSDPTATFANFMAYATYRYSSVMLRITYCLFLVTALIK